VSGKKLIFIINPISGTKNKSAILKQIAKRIPNYVSEYEVFYTHGPSHATDLAKKAVKAKADIVIAIGGDGTVNETASGLLHSNTLLGIIPTGSGNGLSRHLGIPTNVGKALRSLKNSEPFCMDVCTVNGIPFYNVAGIGYDAKVAHDFSKKSKRGFGSYLQSIVRLWFSYKPKSYQLKFDGIKLKTKALMVSFANGSQFGNNFYIAPNAKLNDGLMDIAILKKFPDLAIPIFTYQIFKKKIDESKYSDMFQAKEVFVKQKSEKIHLDGEPFQLGKSLHFKVLPGALNILAPKEFINERQSKYSLSGSS
tara:strand:+ start:19292 stop:20218 length:927 start_codon:yes stop_codon:yes gene_type:complete